MNPIVDKTPDQPVAQYTADLHTNGYVIIGDALTREEIAALSSDLAVEFDRIPFCIGDFYGPRTKRLGSLLRRSAHAEALVLHPLVLAIAQDILGPACDCVQLNLTQAIAVHPGAPQQYPHRDEDMWQGVKGHHEYLLNVIWPLDPFTKANGATRILPSDPADTSAPEDEAGAIIMECEPGAAICFLGSTLHGAGANRTKFPRRAVIVSYCLGWLKPYENQWLAYPPEVARHFSPDLAALIGYRQHRPNLGNVEGLCPSVLLKGTEPDPIGAQDALRPDQAEIVASYAARQRVEGSGGVEREVSDSALLR